MEVFMNKIYYTHIIDSTKEACDTVKEYTHSYVISYIGQKFINKAGLVCFLNPNGTFIHWDWTEEEMKNCYPDCEYICIDDGIIGVL